MEFYIWGSRRQDRAPSADSLRYNFRINDVQETDLPEKEFMDRFLPAWGQAPIPSPGEMSLKPPPGYKPENGEIVFGVPGRKLMSLLNEHHKRHQLRYPA